MISENCFVKGFIDILIPKDNKGSYLWLRYPEIIEKPQCKGLASACMLGTAMPVTPQTQLQILESEAEAQWNNSGDYSYLSLSSVLFCRPKIKGYNILEELCPHGCKISRAHLVWRDSVLYLMGRKGGENTDWTFFLSLKQFSLREWHFSCQTAGKGQLDETELETCSSVWCQQN